MRVWDEKRRIFLLLDGLGDEVTYTLLLATTNLTEATPLTHDQLKLIYKEVSSKREILGTGFRRNIHVGLQAIFGYRWKMIMNLTGPSIHTSMVLHDHSFHYAIHKQRTCKRQHMEGTEPIACCTQELSRTMTDAT